MHYHKFSAVLRYIVVIFSGFKSLIACDLFDEKALTKVLFQAISQKCCRVDANYIYYNECDTEVCHYTLNFNSQVSDTLISNIYYTNYAFNTSKPALNIRFNEQYHQVLNQKIRNCCCNLICDHPEQMNDSLKALYNIKAISDCVVDKMLKLPESGLRDFRVQSEKKDITLSQ